MEPNTSNYFSIILTDDKGDRLPCQPNNLTITDMHIPSAPLPYHIGIQVWDSKREITIFKGLKGLENAKWSEIITPDHDCTLPFIRMVAGPMDYTPGIFKIKKSN